MAKAPVKKVADKKSENPDYFKLPFEVHYSECVSVTQYEFKSDIETDRFADVKAVHMEQGRSWGALFSCDKNNGPELYCCLTDSHDEVEPSWLVEAASRRQKWIDQAQSLNIYMAGASGKKLDDTYKLAWLRGLKTTYYLRTMAATHIEKSTVASGQLNSVSSGGSRDTSTAAASSDAAPALVEGAVCTMRPGDPGFDECEACQ